MLVISLARPVACRMAVEATRMLQHATGLDEERARALRLIADRCEGLWRTQVVRVGGGGRRAGQRKDGEPRSQCIHERHCLKGCCHGTRIEQSSLPLQQIDRIGL